MQLPGRFTPDTNHIKICTVTSTPPGSIWAFKYLKVEFQKMILLTVYCEKWVIMTEMPYATEILEEKYIMMKM